jgi:hypothetical protein
MSSSLIDAVRSHLPAGLDVPVHPGGDEQGDLLHALAAVPDPRRLRSRGHGRAETCTVKATTVQTPGGLGFPHAPRAVRTTRTRTISGTTTRRQGTRRLACYVLTVGDPAPRAG